MYLKMLNKTKIYYVQKLKTKRLPERKNEKQKSIGKNN